MTAERLYEEAWQQPMTGDAASLWSCISRLKSKLAASDQIALMNFRGQGYQLELVGEHAGSKA